VNLHIFAMTNPNDSWRHQSPAAPHAPSHDSLTPGLPLQSSQPFQSLGGPDHSYQPASVGYSAAGGSGAGMLLVRLFVILIFAGPIFGTLYPLATGVALVAGVATNVMLAGSAHSLGVEGRLAVGMIIAHLTLTKATKLREGWHGTLELLRLRPRLS
jgi:RNA polymerase sigma-70 factor, ECF subfamily